MVVSIIFYPHFVQIFSTKFLYQSKYQESITRTETGKYMKACASKKVTMATNSMSRALNLMILETYFLQPTFVTNYQINWPDAYL